MPWETVRLRVLGQVAGRWRNRFQRQLCVAPGFDLREPRLAFRRDDAA